MTDLELARYLLGLVLYRAGGEQAFEPAEIDEIRKVVAGVTFGVDTRTGRIVVRAYTPTELEAKIAAQKAQG